MKYKFIKFIIKYLIKNLKNYIYLLKYNLFNIFLYLLKKQK